jgi:hypothetical protein
MRRLFLLAFLGLSVALAGCSDDEGPLVPISPMDSVSYSFETGFEGWTKHGTDLDHNGNEIEWFIQTSSDTASRGTRSLEYFLNNLNDAGKIWVERVFIALPNRTYDVELMFDFASRDYGDVNLFRIIAGASGNAPRSATDLTPFFQGTTGNASPVDVGYVWSTKTYDFTVTSDSFGRIYVFVGVWGTYEAARTYYVDDVEIRFDLRP